ncbi:MAG: amidohydrolase family protein [Anaerolineae bacterium]|jgi:predicted TIM-barrel fold metal-dependent hydrolase
MFHPLRFLDINCAIGPYYNPPPGHDWSLSGLLAKMDDLGIAEACPACLLGRDLDPATGNDWLIEHAPASDRIHPVWTAAPHHTGEFPSPERLVELMGRHGIKMLRLWFYPTAFNDRLDLPLFGELFDALAQHRVPVLFDVSEPSLLRAGDLEPVLRGWPGMPVILSVPKQSQNERWFFYLWERYGSFYLDLPGYQILGGIEAVVNRFGPDRLLYGSRYPYFTPLQTMLHLIYSEIEEEAKRAIAGDTARRLLQGVKL